MRHKRNLAFPNLYYHLTCCEDLALEVQKHLDGSVPPAKRMEQIQKKIEELLAQSHYGRTTAQQSGSYTWSKMYYGKKNVKEGT